MGRPKAIRAVEELPADFRHLGEEAREEALRSGNGAYAVEDDTSGTFYRSVGVNSDGTVAHFGSSGGRNKG